MPKTNHKRNFKDERDYTVPGGDWACGKHGAANQRRGAKKGINRANRSREQQGLREALRDGEEPQVPVLFREVGKAHDHQGRPLYIRY